MSQRDTRWLKRPRFEDAVKDIEKGGPPITRPNRDALFMDDSFYTSMLKGSADKVARVYDLAEQARLQSTNMAALAAALGIPVEELRRRAADMHHEEATCEPTAGGTTSGTTSGPTTGPTTGAPGRTWGGRIPRYSQ